MSITSIQLKVFFGTLIATFIISVMHLLGINPPQITRPLPFNTDTFFDVIVPKLDVQQNTYRLKKEVGFIAAAQAGGEFENAAAYAVVAFDTGEVIASKNLDKRLPIASLTKIMTSVVALDLADPTELFTVTKKAANKIPTKIGERVGEKLTLEELLHAVMMTSANDATETIRDGIDTKYGGGYFIRAMNEKAMLMGLKNSNFTNAQGFDIGENYSTVEDLAILSHYALSNYPLIAKASAKEYVLLPENAYHKQFDLFNWNGLIGVYPGVTGLKIGNTEAAGKTTVVVAERNGTKLMTIVLGAPGIIERDMWAAQLLDVGYTKMLKLPPIGVTEAQLQEKYATWKYW